jgi:hypothetical protein
VIDIVNCEQGTEDWFRARMGLPTASEFHAILAKGEGKTRKSYMLRLAGEIVTGEPSETYSNGHMERGKALEPEARELYAFMADAEPQQVGFIRNFGAGCSPDSLLGTAGMLEIKTKLPALLIECILRGDFPPEHKAQCQGALWVAEREWIDLAVFWPKMPLFVQRAYRDEAYIASLRTAVAAFGEELAETVERVRKYGAVPVERAA